jgi:hypothetical protein
MAIPLQVLQKQQSLVATTMKRVIASTQLDENGNLAWITAGHWNLDLSFLWLAAMVDLVKN